MNGGSAAALYAVRVGGSAGWDIDSSEQDGITYWGHAEFDMAEVY